MKPNCFQPLEPLNGPKSLHSLIGWNNYLKLFSEAFAKVTKDNLETLSEVASTVPSSAEKMLEQTQAKQFFKDFFKVGEGTVGEVTSSLASLGSKLLPELGDSGFGLLQMLCEEEVRQLVFAAIPENRDPKTKLLKMLDDPSKVAAKVGYAKLVALNVAAYLKKLQHQSENVQGEEVLKIAFAAILQPLADHVQFTKDLKLPCTP